MQKSARLRQECCRTAYARGTTVTRRELPPTCTVDRRLHLPKSGTSNCPLLLLQLFFWHHPETPPIFSTYSVHKSCRRSALVPPFSSLFTRRDSGALQRSWCPSLQPPETRILLLHTSLYHVTQRTSVRIKQARAHLFRHIFVVSTSAFCPVVSSAIRVSACGPWLTVSPRIFLVEWHGQPHHLSPATFLDGSIDDVMKFSRKSTKSFNSLILLSHAPRNGAYTLKTRMYSGMQFAWIASTRFASRQSYCPP